jgi:hypothetical protein
MPPLIAAMLVGAGAYAGLKALRRIVTALSEPHADLEAGAAGPDRSAAVEKDLGALELDAATGIYRPSKASQ